MKQGRGQFCAIARAQDVLGGRWTLLVLREVLSGGSRFSDIRRGLPRISRSVLADRLKALADAGLIARTDTGDGPVYSATPAGADVMPVLAGFAAWGQAWLPRRTEDEDLDLDPLVTDMARRVDEAAIPDQPTVVRVALSARPVRFILLKPGECAACTLNPGFPEALTVAGPIAPLAGWWRGDIDLAKARHDGLRLNGPQSATRAFPRWFRRYLFADLPTAAAT